MADVVAPIVLGRAQPSVEALQLLNQSHAVSSRALLLNDDNSGSLEMPLIGGSITSDAGSTVRRSGSLTILGAWADDPERSYLTPYGPRVRVDRGVRVVTGETEWVPLGHLRITEVGQSSDDEEAQLKLTLKDEFFTVQQDRFDVSTSTSADDYVVPKITQLITDSVPGATVIDLTGSQAKCGVFDMQQDRAAGIVKLATSIGAVVYCGRGWKEFIIRPVPTLRDEPRWELTAGEGGNLIEVSRTRKAEGVYNRAVAMSVSDNTVAPAAVTAVPTGTVPAVPASPAVATPATTPVLWAEAMITDPASPMAYGGPFGKVTRYFKSPALKTQDQCQAAAAALLEKARGLDYEVDFTSLVNPALDADDVIWSTLRDGRRRTHLTKSAGLPLSAKDSQSVGVRTEELPAEDQSQAASSPAAGSSAGSVAATLGAAQT